MKRNDRTRYWVAGLAVVALAVASRGDWGDLNAAENAGKSVNSFAFNALAFARLPPRNAALAKKFKWPGVDAFRNTYGVHEGAQPIPVVTGHLIVIGGPGLTTKAKEGATWADVVRMLPQAQIEQENYGKLLDAWVKGPDRGDFPHEEKAVNAEECQHVTFALVPGEGGWQTRALMQSSCPLQYTFRKLPGGTGSPTVEVHGDTVIAFKPDVATGPAGLHPELWESWTFATTLMKLDRALYRDAESNLWDKPDWDAEAFQKKVAAASKELAESLAKSDEVALAAVRKAIDHDPSLYGYMLEEAATRAEKAGNLELALEVRSHYRPVGSCSMDRTPQEAARRYANLCFKAGDLACYLNLQVMIMGDNFQRVAYSNYGEASHETEAEKLRDIGIDVRRFLRGIIVQYAAPGRAREELGPWRLARSIIEAGEADNLRAYLRSTATNPAVDPYNRLRATQVWAYVEFKEGHSFGDTDLSRVEAGGHVKRVLGRESLHPIAREWVQKQFTD